jgi:hypothetical protein
MKIIAFCLFWILILTAPGMTAQQGAAPNQSWDALRQLLAGDKLQVERKAGKKKVSGEFVGVSETELVIERKGKNESLSRDEVKKVWRFAPSSSHDEASAATAVIAPIIGIPMILAGRRGKRTLIYSAP